jgi:hypothetical protein
MLQKEGMEFGLHYVALGLGVIASWRECDNEPSGSMKGGRFLDHLSLTAVTAARYITLGRAIG